MLHLFAKATQVPGANVNEQFHHFVKEGVIAFGTLELDLTAKTAHLLHHGDTILDVAFRLPACHEVMVLRDLMRKLGCLPCNEAAADASERQQVALSPPGTPDSVAQVDATVSPQAVQAAANYRLAMAAAANPVSPATATPALLFDALPPAAPTMATAMSEMSASDSEPAAGDVWRLVLPNAVCSATGGAAPPVSAALFPFDPHAGVWRCEVPRNALAAHPGGTAFVLQPTPAGAQQLARAGLRLDVAACLKPSAAASDGAAPFLPCFVASVDPARASGAAFALSWPTAAAHLPAGLPDAVVLFVGCVSAAQPFPAALGTGALDAHFAPPQPQPAAAAPAFGQPVFGQHPAQSASFGNSSFGTPASPQQQQHPAQPPSFGNSSFGAPASPQPHASWSPFFSNSAVPNPNALVASPPPQQQQNQGWGGRQPWGQVQGHQGHGGGGGGGGRRNRNRNRNHQQQQQQQAANAGWQQHSARPQLQRSGGAVW